MANYLLGKGERLLESSTRSSGGGGDGFIYSLAEFREVIPPQIKKTFQAVSNLPASSCPDDQVVFNVTLHPDFLAMSYYPNSILNEFGLQVVGSHNERIHPRTWNKKAPRPPEGSLASCLFTMTTRSNLRTVADKISQWEPETDTLRKEAGRIESVSAPDRRRIKGTLDDQSELLLEVVLHTPQNSERILEAFYSYIEEFDISANMDLRLSHSGLTFLPVRAPQARIDDLLNFTLIRVIRRMPRLSLNISPMRSHVTNTGFPVTLPTEQALDPTIKVALFDGGATDYPPLSSWVTPIESGLQRNAGYTSHGVGVTSAALFGPLTKGETPPRPFANMDHWSVIDPRDNDLELYAALNRIKKILSSHSYDFVNLSIGPDIPMEEDDVSAWTSTIDLLLADGNTVATVAVGNNGENDSELGLNRIQPPSDAVNAIAVGAATHRQENWDRTDYSAQGPGRSPGLVKPDVVAFGGTNDNPYYLLDFRKPGYSRPEMGTSFSAPSVLRLATGIRATMGRQVNHLATKALLVHHSRRKKDQSFDQVGWGRVPSDISALLTSSNDEAHILYQGELTRGNTIRAPIPLPVGIIQGMVILRATFCYTSHTDSNHAGTYTREGLEIVFRPKTVGPAIDRITKALKPLHDSKPFFNTAALGAINEEEQRKALWKWETVRSAEKTFRGSSLDNPVFDIHYLARQESRPNDKSPPLPFALIITVSANKMPNLYDQIVRRYQNRLEIMKPVIQVPVPTSQVTL